MLVFAFCGIFSTLNLLCCLDDSTNYCKLKPKRALDNVSTLLSVFAPKLGFESRTSVFQFSSKNWNKTLCRYLLAKIHEQTIRVPTIIVYVKIDSSKFAETR